MSQLPLSVTRPDVAALSMRSIRSCLRASKLSKKTAAPFSSEYAIDEIAKAISLEHPSKSIDIGSVTCLELVNLTRKVILENLEKATLDLALLYNLDPTSLTNRDSLNSVLRGGRHRLELVNTTTVSSLPITRRTSAVLKVVRLLDELESLHSGKLLLNLEKTWNEPISHKGFDQVVDSHCKYGNSSALAWSVIGYESQRHINLVWHQANKLERLFPNRDASDMLALGWMGLRVALRLYDPTLGFSFSTYACTRITGAIRDGVRSESPVPKRLGTFSRKVASAEELLAHSLGRSPTLAEVANHLGVHLDDLKILPRLQNTASIDELESNADERGSASTWLIDNSDPADLALNILRRDAVDAALASLSPEDAAAVRLLVMDGMRPAEAQEITGEAPRRLRVRRDRGLENLREQLSGWRENNIS
jgi:hypothetical protein